MLPALIVAMFAPDECGLARTSNGVCTLGFADAGHSYRRHSGVNGVPDFFVCSAYIRVRAPVAVARHTLGQVMYVGLSSFQAQGALLMCVCMCIVGCAYMRWSAVMYHARHCRVWQTGSRCLLWKRKKKSVGEPHTPPFLDMLFSKIAFISNAVLIL